MPNINNDIHKPTSMGGDSRLPRKKVLFIMHMPPPVHGASLVGKWIHDSEYINQKFECHYLNLAIAGNIADIGKFSIKKLNETFKIRREARNLIKTIKPDLIYITPNTTGGAFFKDSIIVNSIKSMGVPVLAHFHNKGVSFHRHNPFYKRMYHKFFKGMKVLLIIPSLYEDAKEFLHVKDIYFCPNGTPKTMTEEIPAERHNDTTEILFLANMIPSKGVLDLLDALYLLRVQRHKFHCTLIGEETEELSKATIDKKIHDRNLKEYVDYIGPKYGEEKNNYLRNTDILVLPTYYKKECFPLVVLEAMEYKIPVVATSEAGIPYSVIDGKTGLLCKSRNPIDLSEKLCKLLENPELRWKMGEEGYKLREEKYDLEIFEKNFGYVLEQVFEDIENNNLCN